MVMSNTIYSFDEDAGIPALQGQSMGDLEERTMKKYQYQSGMVNISGKRIRDWRKQRRMSQTELAAKMQMEGVILEQDVISRIENGGRLVTDYELLVFARVLGVSLEQLIEQE